jgi:hypothetical protein
VSDGYWISKLGRPVVVIVQKVFEVAAKTQARVLGAADLPICAYPPAPPGGSVEPIAAALAERVVDVLKNPKGQAIHG